MQPDAARVEEEEEESSDDRTDHDGDDHVRHAEIRHRIYFTP